MLANLKRWWQCRRKKSALVISREKHSISRKHLSKNALKVLYRIRDAGYEAYLVGGGIRDLLIERTPKDFDVVTNARPEQIRHLFSNCRLIGRRFRLAHIHFGRDIIEVATFRGPAKANEIESDHDTNHQGMLLRDNVYGTLEEDVWRRDFTVNAIYYNIADYTLVDFVEGVKDVEKRVIRLIGDPQARYREDPVRMLRAIRFAAKLGFTIEINSAKPILKLGNLVSQVATARLYEEILKLFLGGSAVATYKLLGEYQLFKYLFPKTHLCYENHATCKNCLIQHGLATTDQRLQQGRHVAPGYLFAVLLWYPLLHKRQTLQADGLKPAMANSQAIGWVLSMQKQTTILPKYVAQMCREIFFLQFQLANRSGKRAAQWFNHPRFRAGYDFLMLRSEVGDQEASELLQWWKAYIAADDKQRWAMASKIKNQRPRRSRRRKTAQDKDV